MSYIITADRGSDILDLLRGSKFDRHVFDYRRAKYLTDRDAEYALRRQALDDAGAQLIADFRSGRRLNFEQAGA